MFENFKRCVNIILSLPSNLVLILDQVGKIDDMQTEIIKQNDTLKFLSDVVSELVDDNNKLKTEIQQFTFKIKEDNNVNLESIRSEINLLSDRLADVSERNDRVGQILDKLIVKVHDINDVSKGNRDIQKEIIELCKKSANDNHKMLTQIRNEILAMDGAARLILLSSVAAELEKSMKKS